MTSFRASEGIANEGARGWRPLQIGVSNVELEEKGTTGPCWKVEFVWPRALVRSGLRSDVVREEVPDWKDVVVYAMPERTVVPHGQSGPIDAGDVACTTENSQLWLHAATGEEAARYCHAAEWTNCREAGGSE